MENQCHSRVSKNGHHKNGHNGHAPALPLLTEEAAFGYPRDFLQNHYVYLVISPRAGGLSVGINLNPVHRCNFDCLYCEIDRSQSPLAPKLDVNRMAKELRETLELANGGYLRQWQRYANLPEDMLQVRHVALSGDGEPTLATNFIEAVHSVAHVRATGQFFKMVLVTNSTALDRSDVQDGLRFLARNDEIWAKLDGGTQAYINLINGATVSLDRILSNILLVGRQRPIVIQSLFPAINGEPPADDEIKEYAARIHELKEAGAQISLVQIYSATRPMTKTGCSHLPLKILSKIAKTVREVAGVRAEVF